IDEARHWAETDYATGLSRGTSLDEDSRKQIISQLATYTGLPQAYVARSNLRIDAERFEKELLIDQHKIIGRFDGRITADDTDGLNDFADFDPSLEGYRGVFSTTINDYLRRELHFNTDQPYEILSPRVNPWDFDSGHGTGGFLDVAPELTQALASTPSLKVLICCGYYDLATPFATVDYTINAMPLTPALRARVKEAYFESGHMIYLSPQARSELKSRLATFFHSGD
ncbi:MAG: peptidase S10, partial [Phycisphaerae bacterium]|nr:peptidase S10 [Phycisphaerae bacterium]